MSVTTPPSVVTTPVAPVPPPLLTVTVASTYPKPGSVIVAVKDD